jgi:hypothetical protein
MANSSTVIDGAAILIRVRQCVLNVHGDAQNSYRWLITAFNRVTIIVECVAFSAQQHSHARRETNDDQ